MEGNTNGIGFTVYDKEADLKKKGKNNKAKKASGILRVEVRLKKRKAIRKASEVFTDGCTLTTKEQIMLMAKKSSEIFKDSFVAIVPYGNFYQLKDAEDLVNSSDLKKHQKEKMLRLLRLIPEKKSLYLALKELNVRNTDNVLNWFAKLNVSPITISKRENIHFLENLYNYL